MKSWNVSSPVGSGRLACPRGSLEMSVPQLPLARTRNLSEVDRRVAGADSGSGIEASLLQLIHNHHVTSYQLREQTENAKKDAVKTASRVSELLVDAVNGGVQGAFINEKIIEHETRALSATIVRFKKQTDQWLAASRAINTAIKEIGDFENWMRTMEFDCKSISAAVRNIHQT